jgi:predicted DNA-binding protein YlxM (UPF0122 family)
MTNVDLENIYRNAIKKKVKKAEDNLRNIMKEIHFYREKKIRKL